MANEEQIDLPAPEQEDSFRKELAALINKHSLENRSDTPDFVLADYLLDCLGSFDAATNTRGTWYGYNNDAVKRNVSAMKEYYQKEERPVGDEYTKLDTEETAGHLIAYKDEKKEQCHRFAIGYGQLDRRCPECGYIAIGSMTQSSLNAMENHIRANHSE